MDDGQINNLNGLMIIEWLIRSHSPGREVLLGRRKIGEQGMKKGKSKNSWEKLQTKVECSGFGQSENPKCRVEHAHECKEQELH